MTQAAFGIYIHWPFCAQKCPYCDFNSHVRHQGWDEARFLAAYKRELDHVAELLRDPPPPLAEGEPAARRGEGEIRETGAIGSPLPRPLPVEGRGYVPGRDTVRTKGDAGTRTVSSIFFGGGTPSLMKPATTAAILDHIAKLWPVAPGAEVTLEANPGSVEATRFAGYKSAGVNRVSMGLQSLRDDQLKKLGRIHTVAEAKAAFGIARRTFDRFSFDLIYARPGQTPQDWRAELDEALSFSGQHLSLYQLTIEPDTPFAELHARGKLKIPDNDAALELYDITQTVMATAGLPAYEISNHAVPGEESRHNLIYWRYDEYVGVGPGAHGRLDFGGARHSTSTERHPERWADLVHTQGHGFTELTPLTSAEQADEMLLMGLRLSEGLDLTQLARRTGRTPSRATLSELIGLGLLQRVPPIVVSDGDGHDGIRACIGPGACPDTAQTPQPDLPRIRAIGHGRFVLNELVLRLSQSFHARSATQPLQSAS